MTRIEAVQVGTPSLAQKKRGCLKNLRNGVQAALTQVAEELGNLKGRLAKLEEQAKQKPVAKIQPKAPSRTRDTSEGPFLAYRVGAEDTLASIAQKYSTTEEEIVAINPSGIDYTYLHAGQMIYIPIE